MHALQSYHVGLAYAKYKERASILYSYKLSGSLDWSLFPSLSPFQFSFHACVQSVNIYDDILEMKEK